MTYLYIIAVILLVAVAVYFILRNREKRKRYEALIEDAFEDQYNEDNFD